MNKSILLLMALAMITEQPVEAKKKDKKPAEPVKKEAPITKGFLSIQKDNDKWYCFVPDSLLGRPFLAVTRYVATPSGESVYGGEEVTEQTFYWEKTSTNQLMLRSLTYLSVADSTQAIVKAVKASSENPIVEAFKIEKTQRDTTGTSYKVEIGKLFSRENMAVGFDENGKKRLNITSFNPERSYIQTIHTYPINTEIRTVRTYNSKDTNGATYTGTGVKTFEMNTSFVLLPKEPMRKRLFDPRVGYFTNYYTPFSDNQQSVKNKSFITRWRLEPKDEDVEKMKRGELVEPKRQIVYYIDPATPKQWRPYLIQGVNDWNVAFEQAGFKNAIIAKEWPENDSTMSMEDARYSVIRYLASPISNAYGPHINDPRSGEIIESHVGWYHNVMKLVHDWYMIQAGAVDEGARRMKFDDDLMGQLIRFVSSHEIGHTLGLRHNMGASHATPVDSLRNKQWVEAHGHTASIMDYARFNYVAQPEDNIGRDGLFPRIGDYDKWAIEWGYKPIFDTKDEEEDRLVLNKKIIAQLKKGERFWFGGEGMNNDPRAQMEDLGDDAMKASEYGIKNLKRIVKVLPEWTKEEGDLNDNIKNIYNSIVGQFLRYEFHVIRNIGGLYTTYKSVEESGAVYHPETKATQKEAMAYLNRNVFTEPTWLVSESYINRIATTPLNLIKPIATQTAMALVNSTMLTNIAEYSYGKDAYQPTEYINDLVTMVYKEASTGATVSPYRRYLQTQMLTTAASNYSKASGEGRTYLYSFLQSVRKKIATAGGGDGVTKAHFNNLLQIIKDTVDKK